MIRRPIWMPGRFATSTSSATLGDRAAAPLTGDSLVHADMRADNLVLRADGTTITIVDWPWASLGATWFDRLMLLVNVRCYNGQLSTDIDADPDDITAVLAGVAGYIVDAAAAAATWPADGACLPSGSGSIGKQKAAAAPSVACRAGAASPARVRLVERPDGNTAQRPPAGRLAQGERCDEKAAI
jgi:hypothetical protein